MLQCVAGQVALSVSKKYVTFISENSRSISNAKYLTLWHY